MESLKSKRKNFPKSIKEMSKEMLQETLRKKKECNAKAQSIVEELCECNIEEEWFLENLQFINQSHFEDVTVERAILKICGYPLCKNKIEKILPQQYHISTRYNKVFDITERKNFCSNHCYKAAMHIKNQLFTSPLWFRDQEIIPKFDILKSSQSELGKEVKIYEEKLKNKVKVSIINKDDSSHNLNKISDLPNCNLTENVLANNSISSKQNYFKATQHALKSNLIKKLVETDVDRDISLAQNSDSELSTHKLVGQNLKENETIHHESEENIIKSVKTCKDKNKQLQVVEIPKTNVENIKFKILRKPEKSNIKSQSMSNSNLHQSRVEKCIFEWVTVDTLFFLFGENKLKELLSGNIDTMKEKLAAKLSMATYDDKIEKMIKLYELLSVDSYENDNKYNLKPLPDYSVLQEESKNLKIKVNAFYGGQLEIREIAKKEDENEGNEIYLPTIDSKSQNFLRRKIVIDQLNKTIPKLIEILNADISFQMNEVRKLVSTFALTPQNITFKPQEWILLGLIVIKLLSLKIKSLDVILKLQDSQDHVKSILQNFDLDHDYLNDLINKLTTDNYIIEKFS